MTPGSHGWRAAQPPAARRPAVFGLRHFGFGEEHVLLAARHTGG